MRTRIEYVGDTGLAYMTSDERRWINHLRKLAVQKPGKCFIIEQPEDNGGFILAKFPVKWLRVRPPREIP